MSGNIVFEIKVSSGITTTRTRLLGGRGEKVERHVGLRCVHKTMLFVCEFFKRTALRKTCLFSNGQGNW